MMVVVAVVVVIKGGVNDDEGSDDDGHMVQHMVDDTVEHCLSKSYYIWLMIH